MQKPTINEIERVMLANGMKVFTQPFDVTMGGIRTKDNKSNKFNDWLFSMYHDKNGKKIYEILPGTTDAGLYYRLNPMQVKGTAIIQHGVQHRGAYQLQDPKKDRSKRGHRGQKAFRQIKSMLYWRDADRDEYLDFDGIEQKSNFATNGHYMGTVGNNVNNWSAGCWGAIIKTMDKLFKIAQAQIDNGLGDKFSFALLHENMF